MYIPDKLKAGDEIRIIAPSRSAVILSEEGIQAATKRLEEMGFIVTFGEHIFESDIQNSSSINSRLEDLHHAFQDPNVKGILTVIGGFNSNELLPYIDYDCIRENPKVFCGYSDITAIAASITAKTGLVTYCGPHFSSFHMNMLQEYQTDYFKKCVMQSGPYEIFSSDLWSDDAWFLDQKKRQFEKAEWKIFNEGYAEGQLYGGNLCTFNLLQGTPHMPDIEDSILFIEDDEMSIPETFARDLSSLLQTVKQLKGLVIGRFQRASEMTNAQLRFILGKHPLLMSIPVLYDVDFGHTQPSITFPIGGRVILDSSQKQIKLVSF
ncbi:LD-carboxypeptidase [Gracilibacillus oryzae]|uniref:LD-carboxypeptidase n=1 Tax=Gracilibacillus oryzae TaxID=1672701 RepID=A0A7C8KPT2_9BACI|nr:S66 peptidase family protein [Gracilibacillus oryzae]KAB8126659.1 LD-carboxypeptidase [Gracilibacillus oryzae]